MSRRKSAANSARKQTPDDYYGSTEVSQFINMIMHDGKKQLATSIVRSSFDRLYAYYMKEMDGKRTIDLVKRDADQSSDEAEVVKLSDLDQKDAVLRLFDDVLDKVGPNLELKSKRIGGANIQVPIMVQAARRSTLAMRFIIKNARARKSQLKSMEASLAQEMIDVLKGSARSLDDKEQTLRMAKANAVFQGVRR
ncbi:MAG: hypothetical protein VX112_05635 [Pseudomonadota bacterium]|nr:hypothetical protein [Pseudomonadota bacterium]